MAGFGDYRNAARIRDIIRLIVGREIDRLRPAYRYATVEFIDRDERRCTVTFGDEPNSITVSMGAVQPQSVGQVVRIGGYRGDRYVADVIGPAWVDGVSN